MSVPVAPVSFPAPAISGAILPVAPVGPGPFTSPSSPPPVTFSEVLQRALTDLNAAQIASDQAVRQLATGEAKSIHEVVLAMEKAGLALQLAAQIRNKLLDAYHEIIRMQI